MFELGIAGHCFERTKERLKYVDLECFSNSLTGDVFEALNVISIAF